jgi:hypothetical protein
MLGGETQRVYMPSLRGGIPTQSGHPLSKDRLLAIMDHFNIDAANPVICLTQARCAAVFPAI